MSIASKTKKMILVTNCNDIRSTIKSISQILIISEVQEAGEWFSSSMLERTLAVSDQRN